MASSFARGGLGWLLGEISLLEGCAALEWVSQESGWRTQKGGVISCAPCLRYSCSPVSSSPGERKHIPSCDQAWRRTLSYNMTHVTFWLQQTSHLSRNTNQPSLCCWLVSWPGLPLAPADCWQPGQAFTRRPGQSTPKRSDFQEGSIWFFLSRQR